MCQGENKNVPYLSYRDPNRQDLISEDCVKDLGVITQDNLRFKERIHQMTYSSSPLGIGV